MISGSTELGERAPCRRPVAGEDRVERHHPRHVRWCDDARLELPERCGRDAQQRVEDEDEDQAEPEVRNRAGEEAVAHGETSDDPLATAERAEHAQWDPDQERAHEPEHEQLERGGKAIEDVLDDRASADERVPEIALKEVLQVEPVLGEDRVVEPEALLDLPDALLARGRSRECEGWVGRQQANDHEGDQRDADDLGHDVEQSPCHVKEDRHVWLLDGTRSCEPGAAGRAAPVHSTAASGLLLLPLIEVLGGVRPVVDALDVLAGGQVHPGSTR